MAENLSYCFKKYGVLATLRTRSRAAFLMIRRLYLVKLWGMHIHPHTLISLKAYLDHTYPKGIHIGEGTAISYGAIVLTHDHIRGIHMDTHIGKYCQVGIRAIVMPGLTIGDHSIIGAGAVVTKDIPPNSIAVGNPARIIRKNITTTTWGKIVELGESIEDQ